jgi:hypothetical protein
MERSEPIVTLLTRSRQKTVLGGKRLFRALLFDRAGKPIHVSRVP